MHANMHACEHACIRAETHHVKASNPFLRLGFVYRHTYMLTFMPSYAEAASRASPFIRVLSFVSC